MLLQEILIIIHRNFNNAEIKKHIGEISATFIFAHKSSFIKFLATMPWTEIVFMEVFLETNMVDFCGG